MGADIRLSRLRPWLVLVASAIAVVILVPPVGALARRNVFAEAVQFGLFATVIPALFVMGAPWRLMGLGQPGRLRQLRNRSQLVRFVSPRPGGQAAGHALLVLLLFVLAVIGWRLPVSVNALARVPGLAVAEFVVFLTLGTALWLELVESPPMLPRLSRPLRGLTALLPMWSIWVLAYILGFSHSEWYSAYRVAGTGAVGDQELATAAMWAIPAICFIPFIYSTIFRWLHEPIPDAELEKITAEPESGDGWLRPPRGWRR